jgi:RNase P protein component
VKLLASLAMARSAAASLRLARSLAAPDLVATWSPSCRCNLSTVMTVAGSAVRRTRRRRLIRVARRRGPIQTSARPQTSAVIGRLGPLHDIDAGRRLPTSPHASTFVFNTGSRYCSTPRAARFARRPVAARFARRLAPRFARREVSIHSFGES